MRKETVLSSQIEGSHSILDELPRFENKARTSQTINDVTEVSNYVQALESPGHQNKTRA